MNSLHEVHEGATEMPISPCFSDENKGQLLIKYGRNWFRFASAQYKPYFTRSWNETL